jgi:adenylate cyclase
LVTAARLSGGLDQVDRNTFDFVSTIAVPRPQQPAAIIVAIDEPSFSAIGKPWPWPRDMHAQLVRSLRQAGARTIAFDIVFADATQAAADRALAAVADSRMILAADETIADTPEGAMLIRTAPLPLLTRAGARVGVTSVAIDPDGVVRRIPTYADSFAQRMASQQLEGENGDRLIQYFGGPRTYPYVSYYQALDPGRYLPPGMLKGRDMIVGLVVQASPEVRQAADTFQNSFTARTGQLVPGVEIQATIVDNLRHGMWIEPVAGWTAFLLLISGSALGYAVAAPQHLAKRLAAVAGAALTIVLLAWLVLRFGRLWASPVQPLAGLVTSFAMLGVADFAAERERRRQIQNAFGRYVAPEVVRRIIEDPDRVKLGGERKMITVLFADIRGFTAISEALEAEPEKLTQLINQILTTLSAIVTAHDGTIDKYIGDCLMGFWNAPLDDPDHATHAVRAGIEMIEKIASIDELARKSQLLGTNLGVSIGVGVNSGDCVVGNMGSDVRFDYTVVGDAVNVASRLQALTKEYDVPILIGEGTVKMSRDRFDYLELAKVRVRGKQALQMIHTIKDPRFSSRSLAGSTGGTNG